MTTITLQVSEGRDRIPRGAAPLAAAAATLWNWAASRLASAPQDPRQDVARMWALANQYDSSQPGLAADLRGAALRWERETGQGDPR